MNQQVRVRFAPSPTGGLHLGGVRTVLFNYLFARHHGGQFILRTEDTDQSRFVPGAEEYIFETLRWCGLQPDESSRHGGPFAPYRQSERKAQYRPFAEQLVAAGHAYYAFDTPAELEAMREKFKTAENPSPQYNAALRLKMRNSLSLSAEETQALLAAGTPHVVRIKMPADREIRFTDMIRGEVLFHSSQVDDKVLLKADGMPTYHLAVVVDDKAMEITHAFRGEEWLPSAPVHLLLWEYLGWLDSMPQWAHLPLILKPDGHGKLSKRDGDRLGFPVFAMDWTDPKSGETTTGFRERGFLPEAFVNLLALLGWNDGSDQEIFDLNELVARFSMERVHKGGAKFDYEKAKWFNAEWIKRKSPEALEPLVRQVLETAGVIEGPYTGSKLSNGPAEDAVGGSEENAAPLAEVSAAFLCQIVALTKDRCTLLTDFVPQAGFFLKDPAHYDVAAIRPKWDAAKNQFFVDLLRAMEQSILWEAIDLEKTFKELAAALQLKPGELMLPLRIMLVGGKFGPGVFDIAAAIGKTATCRRIKTVLAELEK